MILAADRNGPPDSANGGYAAGALASFARPGGDGAVEVTLRLPPPLGRELAVERTPDGGARLLDGDAVVAEARPAELGLAAADVPAVSRAEARAAGRRPEDFPHHPFRTCFGCGPDRDPATAVRLLCGPVREGVVATAWTPPAALAGPDGFLGEELAWVALDCPSSVPVVPPGSVPHVLGRLTARVGRPLSAGEEHVVVAWALGRDGRKAYGASAVLDATGAVCALGRAVWIGIQRPVSARAVSASQSGSDHAR